MFDFSISVITDHAMVHSVVSSACLIVSSSPERLLFNKVSMCSILSRGS